MQLTVRYFAIYRDATGTDHEQVEAPVATPAELFENRLKTYPGLERFEAARVAVNDEMVPWEHPLKDGDQVLFFPPVAGG